MFSAVLLLLLSASSPEQAAERAENIIPQARPVAALLKAVKDGDREQLKTVFSESMRRRFDDEGWEKVISRLKKGFR